MATVNCSIVGQKGRGGSSYGTAAQYLGYGSGTNYEYVLSFKTGSFQGNCKSITFNIYCGNTSITPASTTKTYRYALLSSDSNATGTSTSTNKYYNHYNDVTEANQIAKGTVDWANVGTGSQKTLTISTTALKANTTYYLVMWPYSSAYSMVTIAQTSSHGAITLEYTPTYTVSVYHRLQNPGTDYIGHKTEKITVVEGTSFTPAIANDLPSTHTTENAVFCAWNHSTWETLTPYGVPGVNYFTVNSNVACDVYYKLLHTVTFDSNGVGAAPIAQTAADGNSITLPILTAEGYIFLGWATSATATSGMTGAYKPTTSVTLYAVWKKIHTVTYNANGHGTTPSEVTVEDGNSITLPTLAAEGYIFLGWSTDSTATSGTTGSYTVTASVTLYAVWKAEGSYVNYNDKGTVVKCAVYGRKNGKAVKCYGYYNDKGSAVKI